MSVGVTSIDPPCQPDRAFEDLPVDGASEIPGEHMGPPAGELVDAKLTMRSV